MNISKLAAVAAVFCWLVALLPTAHAHDYRIGSLRIDHPWTRATPQGAKVAGGYLVIHNDGAEPDRLVSAGFAASASTELHEMAMQGSTMIMRELPKGIDVPAGKSVTLAPGGLHLMFMGLNDRLAEGGSIKGHLVFEKAGRIEVDFKIEAMGKRGHDHGSGHGAQGHGVHGHGGHNHGARP
jgi:periplasmic copper chaperone A